MPLRAPGASGGVPIIGRGGEIAWVREEQADITPIITSIRNAVPGWAGFGSRSVGINNPRVSVGKTRIPIPVKRTSVPQVAQPTPIGWAGPRVAPSGPIDRRDTAPNQKVVPIGMRLSDFLGLGGMLSDDQWQRALRGEIGTAAELAILKARRDAGETGPGIKTTPIQTTPPFVPTTKPSTGTKPMDLGALITDLGTTYIKTKYAQTSGAPVQAQPAYSVFDAGSDIVDYFTDPGTGTLVPVKKKKVCRRRRKRLATKSDLGDLAALKAILGNGEAFKAWIATHSR